MFFEIFKIVNESGEFLPSAMPEVTLPAKTDEDLARELWALGDPVRLRLIRLLPRMADCSSRTNVTQLAEALELSQPTVSHHLRVLRQLGLVQGTKMCRDVYYWLDADAVRDACARMCDVVEGESSSKE